MLAGQNLESLSSPVMNQLDAAAVLSAVLSALCLASQTGSNEYNVIQAGRTSGDSGHALSEGIEHMKSKLMSCAPPATIPIRLVYFTMTCVHVPCGRSLKVLMYRQAVTIW